MQQESKISQTGTARILETCFYDAYLPWISVQLYNKPTTNIILFHFSLTIQHVSVLFNHHQRSNQYIIQITRH